MVSYLTMNLDIDGDYKGNIVFTPNMTDRTVTASKIFFPPMFILSDSLIREAIEGIRDLKEAFVSQVMYMKLVKYATDQAKGYKKISIQEANKSGIISDNMKYLLNLWVAKNGNIMINNRVYNIVTVRFVKQGSVIGQPTNYSLTAKVRVIQKERDGMVARQRMTCDDRREYINELYNELFAGILFSRDSSSRDERLAPTMMTNNYGQTTGRTQIAQTPTTINIHLLLQEVCTLHLLRCRWLMLFLCCLRFEEERKLKNIAVKKALRGDLIHVVKDVEREEREKVPNAPVNTISYSLTHLF